jgi:hypothetical protein
VAWIRRRFAICACVLGTATLGIGISAATAANLKTRSAPATFSQGEYGSVTAKCKKGTRAVAGGARSELEFADPESPIFVVYRSRAEGRRKWSSAAYSAGVAGTLTSFAYCRDQSLKRDTAEETVSAQETETVTAHCPRGMKVASGCFDNPDFVVGDETIAIFPSTSMKTGKREWTVTGTNLGDTAGDLLAQVSCQGRKGLKTAQDDVVITTEGTHTATAKCGAGNASSRAALTTRSSRAKARSSSPRTESESEAGR